jgi:hypothetical protein
MGFGIYLLGYAILAGTVVLHGVTRARQKEPPS